MAPHSECNGNYIRLICSSDQFFGSKGIWLVMSVWCCEAPDDYKFPVEMTGIDAFDQWCLPQILNIIWHDFVRNVMGNKIILKLFQEFCFTCKHI